MSFSFFSFFFSCFVNSIIKSRVSGLLIPASGNEEENVLHPITRRFSFSYFLISNFPAGCVTWTGASTLVTYSQVGQNNNNTINNTTIYDTKIPIFSLSISHICKVCVWMRGLPTDVTFSRSFRRIITLNSRESSFLFSYKIHLTYTRGIE